MERIIQLVRFRFRPRDAQIRPQAFLLCVRRVEQMAEQVAGGGYSSLAANTGASFGSAVCISAVRQQYLNLTSSRLRVVSFGRMLRATPSLVSRAAWSG